MNDLRFSPRIFLSSPISPSTSTGPLCLFLLVKLSQEVLVVPKVPEWFPRVLGIVVPFPLDEIPLTSLAQNLFDFVLVFLLHFVPEVLLQGCIGICWFQE